MPRESRAVETLDCRFRPSVSFVCDNPLNQPIGSKGDEPTEPCGPEAMAPIDVPFASLRQATLKSERIRIIGLILVLSFILVVFAIRAVLGGVPEQLHLLPRFTALILASVAYESLMLGMVSRAIKRGSDLPLWAWSANAGIEALIPTITLILLTESPFMGPYRALGAPGDPRLLHLHHPLDLAASTGPLLLDRPGLGAWLRRRNCLHACRPPGRPGFRWPGLSAPGVCHDSAFSS